MNNYSNPYEKPLEEYCTLCDTPIWFWRANEERIVTLHPRGTCTCGWKCCDAVRSLMHPEHWGLRERPSGYYVLNDKQKDRYIATCKRLDIEPGRDTMEKLLPVFAFVTAYEAHLFKNGIYAIAFNEQDVYNCSRPVPSNDGEYMLPTDLMEMIMQTIYNPSRPHKLVDDTQLEYDFNLLLSRSRTLCHRIGTLLRKYPPDFDSKAYLKFDHAMINIEEIFARHPQTDK
jgi:hypothetical protein